MVSQSPRADLTIHSFSPCSRGTLEHPLSTEGESVSGVVSGHVSGLWDVSGCKCDCWRGVSGVVSGM